MTNADDLERRIEELEKKKTSQTLTVMLFLALAAFVLMQMRINQNFNERIEPRRTGVSHAE